MQSQLLPSIHFIIFKISFYRAKFSQKIGIYPLRIQKHRYSFKTPPFYKVIYKPQNNFIILIYQDLLALGLVVTILGAGGAVAFI